jgi:hypothetical protein
LQKTATDTSSMSLNDQTEIELRISKEIRKTATEERIKLIPAFRAFPRGLRSQ